jgi:fibronectin type 3 domain-containing protein
VTRAAALFCILWLAGCAYIGPPKPPALDIPTRITDLRAAEYGDQIVVQFTIGTLTTDGLTLTSVKSLELQVAAGGSPKMVHLTAQMPGPVDQNFAAKDWVGKQVTLMVRATGPKGKASEWSNPVTLAVGVPLAMPSDFKAVSDPKGVRLTWVGSFGGEAGGRYRIFRGSADAMPQRLAESDKPEYVDTAVDFGSPYRYFVQALVGELRQSQISEIVGVTPEDKFPPAVPAGVMAVAGVNSIELAWQPNTEEDLAGYQVYRSVEGGTPERIAGPVDAPNFSDRTVEIGKKYSYTITAIDRTGNESGHSATVEVTAQ